MFPCRDKTTILVPHAKGVGQYRVIAWWEILPGEQESWGLILPVVWDKDLGQFKTMFMNNSCDVLIEDTPAHIDVNKKKY